MNRSLARAAGQMIGDWFPTLLLGLSAASVLAVVDPPSSVSAEPPRSSTNADQEQRRSKPSSEGQGEGECDKDEQRLGFEVYREISRATGGFSYNGGFEHMGGALRIFTDADGPGVCSLAIRRGSVASSEIVRLPVTVDSTIKHVDFILNSNKCDMIGFEVVRPNGSIAAVDEEDVEVIDIPALKRFRIKSPAIGQWMMLIRGEVEYDALAAGVSDIDLSDVSFYRFMPDSHWPVPDEVEGGLPLNVPLFVEATLFGNVKAPTLNFMLGDGSLLQSVPLKNIHSDTFIARYVPTTATEELFVKVTGKDQADKPFERVIRRPYVVAYIERHLPPTKTPDHDKHLEKFHLLLQEDRSADEYSRRAWEYLYDLALEDRLSVAYSIASDLDGRIAYRGASLLVEAGYEDDAIPLLMAMIADGRAPSQVGYDWGRGSSELLRPRMMIKLARSLLSELEDYQGEDRLRVEQFLAGGETPFSKSSVENRLRDEEEQLRAYAARTNPFVDSTKQDKKDSPVP